MIEVKFKFSIDDVVVSVLGDHGVVSNLMLDEDKKQHVFIKILGGRGIWFREDQLEIKK
jgi:hypothetical protein